MQMKRIISLVVLATILWSCEETYIPKPLGYYRIDFPEKKYLNYSGDCSYGFEYPFRSLLDTSLNGKPKCWMNLHYPQYMATVHLTYFNIEEGNLNGYIEDSRRMAMEHTVRADDIEEDFIEYPENKVYGITYRFYGNTATNYQFFVTDSNNHFLRGSLYFNLRPNGDSIKPVANYIEQDLVHLIETLNWR